MSTDSHEQHSTAAASKEHVAEPIDAEVAIAALNDCPRGALALASLSVGLLFIGWLLFYFLLFMPRGSVG
jgi:hypothetical protein